MIGPSAIFMYGRFNPPTIAHERMYVHMLGMAKMLSADPWVAISTTQGKDNPLRDHFRAEIFHTMDVFWRVAKQEISDANFMRTISAKGIFEVLREFQTALYQNVYLLVGSDRHAAFTELLNKYNNGAEFDIPSVTCLSYGAERKGPLSVFTIESQKCVKDEDILGVSASFARHCVKTGRPEAFRLVMPESLDPGMKHKIWDEVATSIENEQLQQPKITTQQSNPGSP